MIQQQKQQRHRQVDSHYYYHPHRHDTLSWPEDDSYYYPSHPIKRAPSSSRKPSFQSLKRHDPYHEMDEGNYHAYKIDPYTFDEKTNPHHRRQSIYHHEPNDHRHHSDSSMDQLDEDEEDSITPQEAEALRNAELNKVVQALTSAATGNSTTKTYKQDTFINTDNHQPPSPPIQQQQQPFSTHKKKKSFFRLASLFRRRKRQKGTIQTMYATAQLGDILDEQQQQEIMAMLQGPRQDAAPPPHEDATKVALLDHIWVFRSDSMLWTGFDYQNQLLLTQHRDDDQGVELYDTHIRHGQLPILVIPKRQVCYYAPGVLDDQVASLQVDCLPNSKHTQFVYRCGGGS
ncbi:hypothetical protein BC941DRAFT_408571 [Chlamydoabsidia padenii]|nr:hypothetical protein BC941DRAFT_408571 [Chlamydoabsidia padenii]